MLDLVPKKLFLTRGKGVHEDQLTSFEYALRDASIASATTSLLVGSLMMTRFDSVLPEILVK